ncbi:MAG TPA: prepilin-type N-terminal cleavage/methylation domain-containing protein [Steroidobacteraceae bacterium]|nr:prepilin-type N-terminal cleavage/methylation domain-containing protein [Steroidobacteraceae bacterium]
MREHSMRNRSRGATLVELIVAIVVVAIAVTSVLGLLAEISTRSAGAMMATQAESVASAYLDEALSKAFADPDGVAEAGRQNFDDVNDYNFIDNGARDTQGNALVGFGQYQVQVNTAPQLLGVAPDATPAVRVTVTVTDPSGAATRLEGFRTNYAGQVLR